VSGLAPLAAEKTREVFWGFEPALELLWYLLAAISVLVFAYGVARPIAKYSNAFPHDTFDAFANSCGNSRFQIPDSRFVGSCRFGIWNLEFGIIVRRRFSRSSAKDQTFKQRV